MIFLTICSSSDNCRVDVTTGGMVIYVAGGAATDGYISLDNIWYYDGTHTALSFVNPGVGNHGNGYRNLGYTLSSDIVSLTGVVDSGQGWAASMGITDLAASLQPDKREVFIVTAEGSGGQWARVDVFPSTNTHCIDWMAGSDVGWVRLCPLMPLFLPPLLSLMVSYIK